MCVLCRFEFIPCFTCWKRAPTCHTHLQGEEGMHNTHYGPACAPPCFLTNTRGKIVNWQLSDCFTRRKTLVRSVHMLTHTASGASVPEHAETDRSFMLNGQCVYLCSSLVFTSAHCCCFLPRQMTGLVLGSLLRELVARRAWLWSFCSGSEESQTTGWKIPGYSKPCLFGSFACLRINRCVKIFLRESDWGLTWQLRRYWINWKCTFLWKMSEYLYRGR